MTFFRPNAFMHRGKPPNSIAVTFRITEVLPMMSGVSFVVPAMSPIMQWVEGPEFENYLEFIHGPLSPIVKGYAQICLAACHVATRDQILYN